MRVAAVIQARTGSSRLPGKVLLPLGATSVLGWVVRAARAAGQVDEVVVATSRLPADDAVVAEADRLGVAVVRGSEDDVLARFVATLDAHPTDAVVRLTADCPMLDPGVIDAVVGAWRAAPGTEYVSTVLVRTLPRGLDVELVRADTLRAVDSVARDHHRVHVTSAIYADPTAYAVMGLCFAPAADDLRVTLDTPEDYELLRALVGLVGDDAPPPWRDVVAALRGAPDLVEVNAHIQQKRVEQG